MADILQVLDGYISENTSISTDDICYNFDEKEGNRVVLWHYDGIFTNYGLRPQVQVMVKHANMATALNWINQIYDIIFVEGSDQKATIINDLAYHFKPKQSPSYLEKDASDLHTYVFNIDVVQDR